MPFRSGEHPPDQDDRLEKGTEGQQRSVAPSGEQSEASHSYTQGGFMALPEGLYDEKITTAII